MSEDLRIPGFRAGGLSIRVSGPWHVAASPFAQKYFDALQDSILLTMIPPDISKSPFDELRCTVPIRLTTDGWTNDGSAALEPSEYSSPSSEEDASSQRFAGFRETSPHR